VVEHDLAKVGVEGSNPFSRSSFDDEAPYAGLRCFRARLAAARTSQAPALVEECASAISFGRVAEWLCSGLQIRVRRFNSDLGLQLDLPGHPGKSLEPRYGGVFCYGDVTRLLTGYRQITQFWR
jgi:hypothetical protein